MYRDNGQDKTDKDVERDLCIEAVKETAYMPFYRTEIRPIPFIPEDDLRKTANKES